MHLATFLAIFYGNVIVINVGTCYKCCMKRKLSVAQGMVEYALMLTMVSVPMIVIYATLGDAAGQVWQTVIDGLSDTHMFEVKEYSLGSTSTLGTVTETTETTETTLESTTEVPTVENTVDPYGPPTETLVDTEIPTATDIPPTATHFIPATYTFTASPVPPTETPTEVPPTPINTATITPTYRNVKNVRSDWVDEDYIQIGIDVNVVDAKLKVININTGARENIECSWYCAIRFYDASHVGGYITITSKAGDDIKYEYPTRSWPDY